LQKKKQKNFCKLVAEALARPRPKNNKSFLLLFLIASPAFARTDLITMDAASQPPVGYASLPYANAYAPKGGSLTLAMLGDFDNLNPFILRGTAPDTVYQVWQPLFKLSDTDSVTEYAELARSVVVNGDRVIFTLDPRAKFSDGVPVRASDVVWTYHILLSDGLPFYAAEYSQVESVAAKDSETVVFTLKPGAGADTVFNLAGLYVLPEHFWKNKDFSAPLRELPVGSGAYQVTDVSWGSSVTYSHVKNWWAAQVPSDTGFNNFDTLTELYFREKSVLLQAFAAGQIDAWVENSPASWQALRNFDAVRDGQIKLELAPQNLPAGMNGFVMNTRRGIFSDARVRQALTLALDAQWTNRALYDGFYSREHSYFSNSPMASSGLPSQDELKLLAPYKNSIPESVFTRTFSLPATDASGYNLPQLKAALSLLEQAGWRVKNFKLVNTSGRQMRFEILLDDPQDERIAIPYAHNLGLLGIDATVRSIDASAYQQCLTNFDFDMIKMSFPVSDDPGSEQADYWGCAAAARPGSFNLAGACTQAIDAMIAAENAAQDAAAKQTAIHALDRLLLNGWYIIPLFSSDKERLAWWQNKVDRPDAPLQTGHNFALWWAK
jgi:microcin C transport system substrate-binding protein